MLQSDLEADPARGELEARERVHRDRVRRDAAHVADGDAGAAPLDEVAHPLAEPWEVGSRDGAAKGEPNRVLHRRGHRKKDRPEHV